MLQLQYLVQLLGTPSPCNPRSATINASTAASCVAETDGADGCEWPSPSGPLRHTDQMFIPGLATDAELLAQLAHRKARALRQHHKSNNFFHRGHIFPRHYAQDCNPSPRLVCHLSLRFAPRKLTKEIRQGSQVLPCFAAESVYGEAKAASLGDGGYRYPGWRVCPRDLLAQANGKDST